MTASAKTVGRGLLGQGQDARIRRGHCSVINKVAESKTFFYPIQGFGFFFFAQPVTIFVITHIFSENSQLPVE